MGEVEGVGEECHGKNVALPRSLGREISDAVKEGDIGVVANIASVGGSSASVQSPTVTGGTSSVQVKENDGREISGKLILNPGDNSEHSMLMKRSLHCLDATNDNNAEEKRTRGEEVHKDISLLKRRFSELQKKRAGYQEHLDFIASNLKLLYLQLKFEEFLAQTEALESEFEEGENQETFYKGLASKLPRREREHLSLLRANRFELVKGASNNGERVEPRMNTSLK